MAKKRMSKKKRQSKQAPKQAPRRAPPFGALDKDAQAYARLLADPCGASLTHPIYGGSDGGYLCRVETDLEIGVTFGDDSRLSGACLFTPSMLSRIVAGPSDTVLPFREFDHIQSIGFLYEGAPSGPFKLTTNGAGVWANTVSFAANSVNAATRQPGSAFLSSSASSVRTVAACMQFMYTGKELDRAGTISFANVNGGSLITLTTGAEVNNNITVENLRATSNRVFKTPDGTVECKWRPLEGDQLPTDPSAEKGEREAERHGGILMTWAGLTPDTSFRLRFVAVYEWTPKAINGLLQNQASRSHSNNTLDHVINALDKSGDWMWEHKSDLLSVGKYAWKAAKWLAS